MPEATTSNWPGDKFERESVGLFLSKLIERRFIRHRSSPDSGALCVALDAEWGAGKTYFVTHWSKDLSSQDHLVVMFDAWKNDLSDDPLIAFLAQLQHDIKPWLKKMPVAETVKKAATKKFAEVMKQGGRAANTVGKAVVKGLVERYAPGAINELVANSDGQHEGSIDDAMQAAGKSASEAVASMLTKTVQAHTDRQAAIDNLKQSIRDLLSYLESQRQIRLPMFVFIDELDRCRPDYAVRLLEGVKHLFDATGVCFIVSTNMKQLAASMQAIYGPTFDSKRYLKRFFSLEYLLPAAKPDNLALDLARDSDIISRGLPVFGALPNAEDISKDDTARLAESFVLVANAFSLTPRSQQQVFAYADAATSGIDSPPTIYPAGRWGIHPVFLFFLAALLHENGPDFFDDFVSGRTPRAQLLQAAGIRGNITYLSMSLDGDPSNAKMTCAQLFITYAELSNSNRGDVEKKGRLSGDFPSNISLQLVNEVGRRNKFSISVYAELIRNAGGIQK